MPEEVLGQSWSSQEELETLARIKRNNEITKGVVRSVAFRKMPIQENGRVVTKEVEVAIFLLPGGIKAYCPASEFMDHDFKSLTGFVGTIQEFIVEQLDLENKMAIVSVKKADEIKKNLFWDELDYLNQKDELSERLYTGVISGFNPQTERIFVKVNGVDCFMLKYDWDHGRIRDISSQIERGTTVEVKVLRIDKERNMVQVSRKAATEDPFEQLEQLKDMEAIAGKISEVNPIHGIFVQLDVGLEVKGMKPSYIEEPVVGDIVSCKVRTIDKEKRHCKVVIIGYPRGKRKRKDVGAFLFE
ncbi:S1 RNA-binding domain-containing protein [Aquibacillus sp. 3ASR75-11]|uniref:S1 RNA-binding domain-containing protein n=1 Tax=Terrihalobacillus insolitus TaxID=2950438 RepID=A0A9X4ALE4_9BACI|nr:S1 RNA-binding domain-containing protein [Terrihalobacillus insolitus]MDC3424297.1 S1 RNA-binding domain-containing protein [Terrihalobacillus insolitus]